MWSPNLFAVVVLGFVAALNACAPAQPQGQQVASVPGPEPRHRVFFGPGDFDAAGSPVEADSYWRASLADVAPFETALDSALSAAQVERTHNLPRDLPEYSVQYVGYVLDGHRRIFANAACRDIPAAETRWYIVLDGGACYFDASFDVDAGHLVSILFNGEA